MFRGRKWARAAAVLVLFTAAIAGAQSAPGLINYQGRLFDDAGVPVEGMSVPMAFSLWDRAVTQDPVTDEPVTMTGTSPLPLAHQNLMSGTVVVTAAGGLPVYESPHDYTIDLTAGTITRVAGGFILDGTPVEIDYVWTNSGSMVWSESRSVEVTGGLYNVALGQVTPIPASLFSSPSLFLEVAVNGETLSPRAPLTSVPYALNAELLDGMDASDFALFGHSHDFLEITGEISDDQVPDNITVIYAADAATAGLADDSVLLGGLSAEEFVHVAGDTVTGSLQVNQQLQVGQDLAVLGGHVGIGTPPNPAVGITNRDSGGLMAVPVNTGAAFSGEQAAVVGSLPGNTHMDPVTIAVLASPYYAVYGAAEGVQFGTSQTGGWFEARSSLAATGVKGAAWGGGVADTYGVKGEATNGDSPAYGGHFSVHNNDAGHKVGVFGESQIYYPTSTTFGYGVKGYAYSTGGGTTYGGYFESGDSVGGGQNVGLYAMGQDLGGLFTWGGDTLNRRVGLAQKFMGVSVNAGNSLTADYQKGVNVAVTSKSSSASYGGYLQVINYHATSGAYGLWSYLDMRNSAGNGYGQYAYARKNSVAGNLYGTYSEAQASDTVSSSYGVYGKSFNTYGTSYGVYGYSVNSVPGTDYALYGAGTDYGLYATAVSGYAGYFNSGRVRVGNTGTEDYVDGSGDLYVADELEVDGTIFGAFEEFYYKDSTTDRYYSVSLVGSAPDKTYNPFRASHVNQYCLNTEACQSYYPVNLPERATVTAFRVWGQTTEASHNFNCILARRSISSYSYAEMSTLTSTNTNMTLSTFSVAWPYIDNATMSYFVFCAETDSTRTASVDIYGIQIAYTVDGPE